MRFAHQCTSWCLAVIAIAAPLGANAQQLTAAAPLQAAEQRSTAPMPAAAEPTSPHSPTRALRHTAMPASGAIAQDATDWPHANRAVAAFPRGHADVLKAEAAQARAHAAPDKGAGTAPHGAHP